ncbi:hypothetical protein RYX36_005869 [Vicia faba]
MTNKNFSYSSFSPNSNNESSNNNTMKFFPLSNNSHIMVGVKRGCMISHALTTTTNNKMATVAQSSSNGFIDLPRDLKEKVIISSSKKSRSRPLNSKNKLTILIIVEENIKIIVIKILLRRDIVEVLINYAQLCQIGIILSGVYGFVSDITLLHTITHMLTLPFHMTSLSKIYVNLDCDSAPLYLHFCFSIYQSDLSEKTFDGEVGGEIKDSSVVWITATLVKKQKFGKVDSTNVDRVAHEANNN